jgi:hypothetical protein
VLMCFAYVGLYRISSLFYGGTGIAVMAWLFEGLWALFRR